MSRKYGVALIREREGNAHSCGLYEATSKGAAGLLDGVAVVVCAYCNQWWWAPTGDTLRHGNGGCSVTLGR